MKHWKIKKCLCLLILPALVWTRIPVSFLTQNLSDYSNNCISLPRAQAEKANRFDVGICGKVFYIIQCNDNNEKIKHLSQITRKFPKHILNFDDWYSPLFTKLFLLWVDPEPCQTSGVAFNLDFSRINGNEGLSFVNKYVLQNNCLCDDWHCNYFNNVDIVIIVVLIIHANKKHSAWYFFFL